MKLYLIRHAIAEPHSSPKPDSERSLTDEGRARMREIARGARALEVELDLVLTSPFRRARETAEILAAGLGGIEIAVLDELASGASPPKVLAALRPYRDVAALALVGHEPDLGRLASFLVTGSESSPFPFKKGGIARFECDLLPGAQHAELEWFLTPKQLRLLGGE